MFQAYGLYSHIQANRLRTVCLLVGFIAMLHVLVFSLLIIFEALGGGSFYAIIDRAAVRFLRTWPLSLALAVGWFAIAYTFHQRMINTAVGAHGVTRAEQPRLYDTLETLCISRGLPTPRLQIMDTAALNAFASGISDRSYTVTVTRGLIEQLEPAELEAVLAHELTHIRNRDTQLMVVAAIFVGVFAFIGDLLIRGWDFPYGLSPVGKPPRRDEWRGADGWHEPDTIEHRQEDSRRRTSAPSGDGKNGAAGAIIAILFAVAVILISWGISTLIRLAMSRTREYLADAGAVELTKNPEALISALRKISTRSEIDVPSRMEAFFIDNPVKSRMGGLLSTHPPMPDRIEALERYAAARVAEPAA